MKLYNVSYRKEDGTYETETFTNISEARKWMKERDGSRGTITEIYKNGEWKSCGEITPQKKKQ